MPQLAAAVRAKYPGVYDDLDDATLESAVLKAHPEYHDLITPQAEATSAPSGLHQAWDVLNRPLVPIDRGATALADVIDRPSLTRSPAMATLEGGIAGGLQGAGRVAAGLTTPLSLAMMGGPAVVRGGLRAGGELASPLVRAAKQALGLIPTNMQRWEAISGAREIVPEMLARRAAIEGARTEGASALAPTVAAEAPVAAVATDAAPVAAPVDKATQAAQEFAQTMRHRLTRVTPQNVEGHPLQTATEIAQSRIGPGTKITRMEPLQEEALPEALRNDARRLDRRYDFLMGDQSGSITPALLQALVTRTPGAVLGEEAGRRMGRQTGIPGGGMVGGIAGGAAGATLGPGFLSLLARVGRAMVGTPQGRLLLSELLSQASPPAQP